VLRVAFLNLEFEEKVLVKVDKLVQFLVVIGLELKFENFKVNLVELLSTNR